MPQMDLTEKETDLIIECIEEALDNISFKKKERKLLYNIVKRLSDKMADLELGDRTIMKEENK